MPSRSVKTHWLGLAAALLAGAASAQPAAAPASLPVPESIIIKNVPALPAATSDDLLAYENIRGAGVSDWHPEERRMLISTRFGDVNQLHEVKMPLGQQVQLTFLKEPIFGGGYSPKNPQHILFGINDGGAENFQFYLLDRDTGKRRLLTDGKSRNISPRFSHDGSLLAYANNSRNGRDFDIYILDPGKPGSERRVAERTGSWNVLDWSPDGSRLLLVEAISANESYLHEVEIASGKVTAIIPRPAAGAETASYESALYSIDGKSIYTVTDRDSELARLVRLDLAAGRSTVLSEGERFEVQGFELSEDGKVLAYTVNEDGMSKLVFIRAADGGKLASPKLPAGVIGGLRFRPGSHELAFGLSWARSPSDVYSFDPDSGKLERWTESEAGGLNAETFSVPDLVRYPTFDRDAKGAQRTIPAFVYRPDKARFPGKRPVYINIHGGPESQARPGFLGANNYFINELGIAMIFPNVRGSSGYGKSYLKLDDGMKREDSVKDIGALLDWIATQPDLDPNRVLVAGGSYGGYMVLASLVHYGDRLCCGYDTVGISNFLTFLKNTQAYRQDLRRVEYGDERDPAMRSFLEKIAPMNNLDRIKKPLLIAQGANDPRVPMSESTQMFEALHAKGVPVWYVVGKNEGHGFSKKENTDYLRSALIEFLKRHLLPPGEAQAAAK